MLLQKMTPICLSFLGILALLWGFFLGHAQPSDYAACRLLKQQEQAASNKSLATTSNQNRKGVVKEIYFTQEDNTRLHYRIESESSVLTLKPEGNRFDLIEKLEKIKCWMQDKLYYKTLGTDPMQQVRFLEAGDGIYRYTSQQFLAQSVGLSLYRVQGHELPIALQKEVPFMRGIAQDASFSVSGKTPQFQAQHFKALLSNHGSQGAAK
jgi:hypothetical protein